MTSQVRIRYEVIEARGGVSDGTVGKGAFTLEQRAVEAADEVVRRLKLAFPEMHSLD